MDSYSKYRETGDGWIATIPNHWSDKRLKYFTCINPEVLPDSTSEDYEFKYIDIGNVSLGKLNGDPLTLTFKEAPSRARRIIHTGDVLVSTVRTYLKSITSVDKELDGQIASTGFAVIKADSSIDERFLYYLLITHANVERICSISAGVSYPATNPSDIGRIKLYLPTRPEQEAITAFLDQKIKQIDDLIAKKERLIELKKEERAAIINQSVTKGLDPDVPMKDSGIEWLGEIPENWTVKKLKLCVEKIGSGITPRGGSSVYQDKGIPFIRSQNVKFEGLDLHDVAYITPETHTSMNNSMLYKDDLLLNITGASIGRCCVYTRDTEANVNQHVCILRADQKNSAYFLNYYLQSSIGQNLIQSNTTGSGREGLNFENIGNFFICTPDLEEQQKIVIHLRKILEKIASNIRTIGKQIDLLKEYKTTLISEAVTGKIKVPNI